RGRGATISGDHAAVGGGAVHQLAQRSLGAGQLFVPRAGPGDGDRSHPAGRNRAAALRRGTLLSRLHRLHGRRPAVRRPPGPSPGQSGWDRQRRLNCGRNRHQDSRGSLIMRNVLRGSVVASVCIFLNAVALTAAEEKGDDATVTIVALGDSITKGERAGVKADETFAPLLEAGMKEQG